MAKRLFGSGQSKTPQQSYDITPPSSPEQCDSSHTVRYEGCVKWERGQCEQMGKIMLFVFAAEFPSLYKVQSCRITEILPDTTIIHQNYCTDK